MMNDITKAESLVPAVTSNATSLLQAITGAASNAQVDIEKMERLFAMHQQMVKTEAEAAFNAAMARAQANITPVANNAANTQTNSTYAKLAAINAAITPIYTAEGLSISFDTGKADSDGYTRTVAIVSHSAGHNRQYHLDLPLDDVGMKGVANKTKVHATGSTTSYARRYLVCMIFNVTTEDDDDGNMAGKKRNAVEPDEEGKKMLEACGSDAALKKAWAALSEEQRKTLNGVMADCKKRIRDADNL
jgi:hypothetical protein